MTAAATAAKPANASLAAAAAAAKSAVETETNGSGRNGVGVGLGDKSGNVANDKSAHLSALPTLETLPNSQASIPSSSDHDGFKLTREQSRNEKRKTRTSNSSSNVKQFRVNPVDEELSLTVYISSMHTNLASEMRKQPFAYQAEIKKRFSDVVRLFGNYKSSCIIVVCRDKSQKQSLLQTIRLFEHDVTITEPFIVQDRNNAK